MSGEAALWIGEQDVATVLDMAEAIAALEDALQAEAAGAARNMVKTHVTWGEGDTLHAIGAAWPASGFAGAKTWAHTHGGAAPVVTLFDGETGALRAVIEAFALGQLRTGGISGVATRRLATRDASTLGIVGSGKQALAQVAAVAAVRPLQRVRVFSPNAERRAAFAARVAEELGIPAEAAPSIAAAVDGASIITLVTRATMPFLSSGMVGWGAHVNAVGAIVPERAEFEPDLLGRCAAVVADSVPQAERLSREFIEYYGGRGGAEVEPLSALVARRGERPQGADLTLFKAMGMGISDLALAVCCYRQAIERGLGQRLPRPVKAELRYRTRNAISMPGGGEG